MLKTRSISYFNAMGLELRLSQELRIAIEPLICTALQTYLTQEVSILRDGINYSAAEGLKAVLEEQIAAIHNPTFKQALSSLAQDQDFQALLLTHAGDIVHKNFNLQEIAAKFIYQKEYLNSGDAFSVETRLPNGSSQLELVKMERHLFVDAVINPTKLNAEVTRCENSIQQLEESKKEQPLSQSDADLLQSFYRIRHNYTAALQIAQLHKGFITNFSQVTEFLLKAQKNSERLLFNFLQDTHVLNHFDAFASDRLAARFRARFKQITPKSTAEDYEIAAINCTAEFVLISLGIIDPNIFRAHKGNISPEETRAYQEFCNTIRISPKALAEHYQLQTHGTLFWGRYFIKGQKASSITDDKIRDFITHTVRKDKDEILEALNFNTVFETLKSQVPELKKEKNTKDLEMLLNGALSEMLAESKLRELITKKIQTNSWRKGLSYFYER